MDYLIWIVCSIIILFTVGFLINSTIKNKSIENKNTILKPTKLCLYVGIAGLTIIPLGTLITFLLPAEGTLDSPLQKWGFLCGMFIFLLLFIYLTFFYLNYKIILYKDYFVYQNFFRFKKTLKYGEIKIDNSKMYTTIQIKKKNGKYRNLFKLSPYLDNSEYFMDYYKASKKTNKLKTNDR